VVEVVEQKVRSRLWTDAATSAWLDARLPGLEGGSLTPFGVADELLAQSGRLIAGTSGE
jgi:LAO/AO transport system kinase